MTRFIGRALPLLVALLIAGSMWLLLRPHPHNDPAAVPAPTATPARPAPAPTSTLAPQTPDFTVSAATATPDPGQDLDRDTTDAEQRTQQDLAADFVHAFVDTAAPDWLQQLRAVPLADGLSADLADVDPANIRPAEVTAVEVADSSPVHALIDVTLTDGAMRVELTPGAHGWEVNGYELDYR